MTREWRRGGELTAGVVFGLDTGARSKEHKHCLGKETQIGRY